MDMSDAFKNFDSGFTYETSINRGSSISSSCSYFTAGIAYRLDFGKWSFRPKADMENTARITTATTNSESQHPQIPRST